jgi:hypothetical protein
MKKYIIYLIMVLELITSNVANAQKATIYVKLLDSSSSNAAEYIFNVEVKNVSFDKYWVQDTAFLRSLLEHPTDNLIYPYLEKRVGSRFKIYEHYKYRAGVGIRAKCLDSCCNCIFLKKSESLKINLPILKCYNMEKGEYRLQVTIGPPLFSCDACKQLGQIYSKYIYFRVR